jgi:microsomal epoxide hydrolase
MPDQKGTATLFHKLLLKLGYNKYWLQGGDWGSAVTRYLAVEFPEHAYGYHTNMVTAYPLPWNHGVSGALWSSVVYLFPSFMLSADDYEEYQKAKVFPDLLKEIGYFVLQSTKPQTIGAAIHDSPLGLAAYITEKFYTWSDSRGKIESRFSKDDLITNLMIYWTSGSFTTSVNYYYEFMNGGGFLNMRHAYVTVPTACALFPQEIMKVGLKSVAEWHYNVKRFTRFEKGGHFASLEEPELLVQDIREFRKQLSSPQLDPKSEF